MLRHPRVSVGGAEKSSNVELRWRRGTVMSSTVQRAAEKALTERYEALLRVSQNLISIRSSDIKKLWTFFYRIRGQVIFVNCKMSLSVPSLYAKQKISPWTRVGFLDSLFPLSQKAHLSSLTRLLPGRKRRLRLPCVKAEGKCPDRPERLRSWGFIDQP